MNPNLAVPWHPIDIGVCQSGFVLLADLEATADPYVYDARLAELLILSPFYRDPVPERLRALDMPGLTRGAPDAAGGTYLLFGTPYVMPFTEPPLAQEFHLGRFSVIEGASYRHDARIGPDRVKTYDVAYDRLVAKFRKLSERLDSPIRYWRYCRRRGKAFGVERPPRR